MLSSFSYQSLRYTFFDVAAEITNRGSDFVVFANRDTLEIAEIFRTSANRYTVSLACVSYIGVFSCSTFKECVPLIQEFFGKKSSARS